jgi:hypothetical protein
LNGVHSARLVESATLLASEDGVESTNRSSL